ncbi:MAG: SAM-dependent methyltransferase [Chloroflexota bacterium]|nr:SAM-dependent methyltransferase [Chloroflexota bacterium]
MELALYHPLHGYYHAGLERIGKRGDYLTSPLISPLFGATLARFIRQAFDRGIPRRILELGAGDGSLAEQLVGLAPYGIVERSPDFRARQQQRLGDRARWLEEVPAGFQGLVLSNELLDALPVHRVDGDGELLVGWDGGFAEQWGPFSTPRIAEYFDRLELRPAGRAEVNLDAQSLMAGVYGCMGRGLVLTIDYGYEAEELFLRHPQGTFLTYFRHALGDNPYGRVGLQDMTSHVDFTSLMRLGESLGLRTVQLATQAEFLIEHGIGELLMEVQRGAIEPADYYRAREAVTTLLNPAGMGGFRVLVQDKA